MSFDDRSAAVRLVSPDPLVGSHQNLITRGLSGSEVVNAATVAPVGM
jgi:hypothetical protein